uniref:DUF3504 domain-containing protein n=1 Tax=Steinernema glaseri TaxID=37863 RepID=A0A1I7YLN6_9BILA
MPKPEETKIDDSNSGKHGNTQGWTNTKQDPKFNLQATMPEYHKERQYRNTMYACPHKARNTDKQPTSELHSLCKTSYTKLFQNIIGLNFQAAIAKCILARTKDKEASEEAKGRSGTTKAKFGSSTPLLIALSAECWTLNDTERISIMYTIENNGFTSKHRRSRNEISPRVNTSLWEKNLKDLEIFPGIIVQRPLIIQMSTKSEDVSQVGKKPAFQVYHYTYVLWDSKHSSTPYMTKDSSLIFQYALSATVGVYKKPYVMHIVNSTRTQLNGLLGFSIQGTR